MQDGSHVVAASPMTKLSEDASQLQLVSPNAPSGSRSLTGPARGGEQAFSAFRAPDTVTRMSMKKKRSNRSGPQPALVARSVTMVGLTPRSESRPSPAPSPAFSHPDTPVNDVLQLDASDGPELRSSKKRGLAESPPELMRSLSSSDSDGGFYPGERRPSPLSIPTGLDALQPPRAAESPVLPQAASLERIALDNAYPGEHALSLDAALLSEAGRSLCLQSAHQRSDEHAALIRSAEAPRTNSASTRARQDNSSGKRFRQTVCDGEMKLLSSSAPAETPLPDMTPRAKLLPVIDSKDGCEYINGDVLKDLIAGKTDHEAYCIIDCRFPFEHQGGCINSPHTKNIWDPAVLEQTFFPNGHSMVDGKQKTAIVFHCEFSSKRAPKMCRHLRTLDRQIVPTSQYPHLCYPEMYVLESGYKAFVRTHPHCCRPGPLSSGQPLSKYTEMLDKAWGEDFRKSQAEYQAAWKKLKTRDRIRSRASRMTTSLESSPQSGGGNRSAAAAADVAQRRCFRPIGVSNHGRARLSLSWAQDCERRVTNAGQHGVGGAAARGISFASMDVATDTTLGGVVSEDPQQSQSQ